MIFKTPNAYHSEFFFPNWCKVLYSYQFFRPYEGGLWWVVVRCYVVVRFLLRGLEQPLVLLQRCDVGFQVFRWFQPYQHYYVYDNDDGTAQGTVDKCVYVYVACRVEQEGEEIACRQCRQAGQHNPEGA